MNVHQSHQHQKINNPAPWRMGPGDPVDPDQDPPDDVGGDGPIKPGAAPAPAPEPDELDDDVGGDGPVKPGT